MDLRLSAVSTSILLIPTAAPRWLTFTFYSVQNTDKHMHVHIRSQVARHDLIYKEKVRKPLISDVGPLHSTIYPTMMVSNSAFTSVIIYRDLK